MPSITATELARNTREILDRVAGRGETLAVERNHVVIATISPPEVHMTAGQALAGLRTVITAAQAERWLAESKGEFNQELRDPWR